MFAAFIATLVCACATSAPDAPATLITFEVNSWGYVQERWTIASSGQATLSRPPSGSQFGTPAETQTFALTPADFERIRITLSSNERFIARGIACENRISDAPYGALKWRRADGGEQKVTFDIGCERSQDWDAFFERITAADGVFHQMTGTPAD